MAETLKIKNFGPIKEATLDNIGQFLVLVGESGSGKSTILKVLSMCRWIYKQQNIRCYLHDAGISRSPFSHNVNSYLNSTGIQDFVRKESEIVFERDGVTITIIGKEQGVASMSVTEPTREELCLEKVCFVSEKRNALPDLLSSRLGDRSIGFYLGQLFEDFKVAKKYISDLSLSAVDVRMRLEKKNGNEVWMIENAEGSTDKFSIHLEDASSGIQSSASLDMLLHYYTHYYDLNSSMNNAVVKYLANADAFKDFRPTLNVGEIGIRCIDMMIEEPEMCLYPNNQVRLLNQIIRSTMMSEYDYVIRTAITTHSPYLLNYLNLLFKAFDKQRNVDGVWLDYEVVDVYAMEDGVLRNLKIKNAHLIDPAYLSQPLDKMFDRYEALI